MRYDKDQIVEEVIKMRIKNMASTATILEYIMKEANVKQPQAYNYLQDANVKIKELYKDIRLTAFEEAIAQLQTMLENCTTVSEQLKVRQELSKTQGLYLERIELSGEVTVKTSWGTD